MSTPRGQLFIIATPIGNMDDISRRAIDTLRQVDVILCEDTRISKRLMAKYGIDAPLESLHEHNERSKCRKIIGQLSAGKQYALISDAGVPVISDPGQVLVAAALSAGLVVSPIPGPNAAVSAVVCSGLEAGKFVFEGFLPATAAARRKRLAALQHELRTLVFYEAPHRIQSALKDMAAVFTDDRQGCLAKELTKIHETIITGSLAELIDWIAQNPQRRKGEFVVVVAGNDNADRCDDALYERWLRILLKQMSPRAAAGMVAEISGTGKNKLYRLALQMMKED